MKRPVGDRLDPRRKKARIRAQELVKRDEQLREPAARRFIKSMEKKSVHNGHFMSIYSVIRDGRELAESLRSARSLTGDERVRALREVINPYLQFVDEAEYCEDTGLRLQDIWRYFRHTWTNQYTTTPGRSLGFIIRDRAREHHPVIGIGSLGSSIVQIRERDAWIGWQSEAFMEFASESPSAELGNWLQKTAKTAIGEIYVEDFFEEELLSATDLRAPKPGVLQRLITHGEKQRELHHRLANSKDLKRSTKRDDAGSTEAHWQERARTHLYRSKRALSLADMLRSRMVLQQHLSSPPTREEVCALLDTGDGAPDCEEGPAEGQGRPRRDRDGRHHGLRRSGSLQPDPRGETRLDARSEPGSRNCLPREVRRARRARSLPQWRGVLSSVGQNSCSWGRLRCMASGPANTTGCG